MVCEDYKALNNLSSADLATSLPKEKVKRGSKLYQVERLIGKRKLATEIGKDFRCAALFLGLLGLIYSFKT